MCFSSLRTGTDMVKSGRTGRTLVDGDGEVVKPRVRVVPCGHTQICNDCSSRLQQPRKCPICRTDIVQVDTELLSLDHF